MRILVSGSLAFDKIFDFPGRFSDHILPDRIHDLNVSFVTESLSENFGGTCGNIAYNLALLGATPIVLGSAGKDFDKYSEWLASKGADMSLVKRREEPTMSVIVLTDKGDNQISAVHMGAAHDPCGVGKEEIPEAALAIVSPGNLEDMRTLPEVYRQKGTPFIFDPGQQIPALSAEDLQNGMTGAKVLISNDYELALILQKTGWSEEDMLSRTEILVTTLGEKGSVLRTKDGTLEIPPAKTSEVKDPTGAGDAYRAGLIFGLLSKWPLQTAGKLASVTGAYAVEQVGTQNHSFDLVSVRARYAENFGELPA